MVRAECGGAGNVSGYYWQLPWKTSATFPQIETSSVFLAWWFRFRNLLKLVMMTIDYSLFKNVSICMYLFGDEYGHILDIFCYTSVCLL